MKEKRFTWIGSVLLAVFFLLPLSLYAYSGPIGEDGGWQTDTDGSITGWARTQFIWVNAANFPDENFRNHVKNRISAGNDGVLTVFELNSITSIDCSSKSIASLEGIAYFDKLKTLNCYSNQLRELDVTQNTALTELHCFSNQLRKLDVTQNTALTYLRCYSNQLTELDVKQNTALQSLLCQSNQLTELDVTQNTALTYLRCYSNQLTELDVTQNTALTYLSCNSNQLRELDVTQNTALTYLYCNSNQLRELDVTQNTALTDLICSSNQLRELDVTQNTALKDLSCDSNQLTELDVSQNTALKSLWCFSNQLTELDVTQNTALTELRCSYNQLRELDVTQNTALTDLRCDSNQLTELDVTQNTALTDLRCPYNQLTELDVTQNTALTCLYCNSNQLTELDVTQNTALTDLRCYSNQLTELDVTQNTALTYLTCGSNQLTELDLSASSVINSSTSSISSQWITPNFHSLADRSKVGIQCHTDTGETGHYGSFVMEVHDGHNHIIVASGTQDVEMLKSSLTYSYQTDYTGSLTKLKAMTVSSVRSAYAMYVNPRSKMKDAPSDNKVFLGTLYCAYPVVVPAETECYIATGVDTEDGKLNLVKIAEEGDVIPTNTPFVVKGVDGSGFYVFREALEEDGDAVDVSGNILAGNIEDTEVEPMTVLTLGIERTTGELGYWKYRGTTLKAHRAYVPASALNNLSADSPGLMLAFGDDMTPTAIRITTPSQPQTAESWYTLDGRRLSGKPAQRGVYIHNGRKEVVGK